MSDRQAVFGRIVHKTEKLEYIGALLNELRKMAAREQFDMLTYLIEMAYFEAEDKRSVLQTIPEPKRERARK